MPESKAATPKKIEWGPKEGAMIPTPKGPVLLSTQKMLTKGLGAISFTGEEIKSGGKQPIAGGPNEGKVLPPVVFRVPTAEEWQKLFEEGPQWERFIQHPADYTPPWKRQEKA